jgi:hypothetical protein
VQCGAVQCSAVQCGAVQCSAVQCSTNRMFIFGFCMPAPRTQFGLFLCSIPPQRLTGYIAAVAAATSTGSRDSSVSIVTGYGLEDRGVGVRVPIGSRISSSPCPDRFWDPPSLLTNE